MAFAGSGVRIYRDGMVTGGERGESYGAQSSHNQRVTLKEDRTDTAELSTVRPRISFGGAV
jgi:hypothetical protein